MHGLKATACCSWRNLLYGRRVAAAKKVMQYDGFAYPKQHVYLLCSPVCNNIGSSGLAVCKAVCRTRLKEFLPDWSYFNVHSQAASQSCFHVLPHVLDIHCTLALHHQTTAAPSISWSMQVWDTPAVSKNASLSLQLILIFMWQCRHACYSAVRACHVRARVCAWNVHY